MKQGERSRKQKFGAVLCIAAAVWFLLPVAWGVVHIGMLYPAGLLLAAAWLIGNGPTVRRVFSSCFGGLARCVTAAVCVGLTAVLATVGFMAAASLRHPEGDAVVIVLGCQVNGQTPSRMLADRCDAAAEYLLSHPETACVASGGQGTGEDISEAQVIRDYLVARGIEEKRIFLEDRSTNTSENLAFSAAVIREQGLGTEVAIASDSFHQLRAALFARKNGLNPYSLGCRTYWPLAAGYWAREVLAVYKALLFGR